MSYYRLLLKRRRLLLSTASLLLSPSRRRRKRVRSRTERRQVVEEQEEQDEQDSTSEICDDPDHFFEFYRMSPQQFNELLNLIGPTIRKKNTNYRKSISARIRLAITLRFLATGCSRKGLAHTFHVGHSTVCIIIETTCKAIWKVMQPICLRCPSSADYWKEIAEGFKRKWDFPMCVGAMNGRSIATQPNRNASSENGNDKSCHGIELLAMCDAYYCFTMISIGDSDKHGEGLFSTRFRKLFNENQLNLPAEEYLPGSEFPLPYCIVADSNFPLLPNLMRPYPMKLLSLEKKVFNYRLSRTQRAIENAFGILTTRWKVLAGPIMSSPDKVTLFCQAACCLHNFLQVKASMSGSNAYCPSGFVDTEGANGTVVPGEWRMLNGTKSKPLSRLSSNMHTRGAGLIRDNYAKYFVSPEGKLPWQLEVVENDC